MAYRNPHAQLAAHEVISQPGWLGDENLLIADAIPMVACDWFGRARTAI